MILFILGKVPRIYGSVMYGSYDPIQERLKPHKIKTVASSPKEY